MRAYLVAGLLLLLGATSAPDSLWAQAPDLPPSSVVNGASFRPAADPNGAVAPGAIVAIFGANLAGETQLAMSVPLSTRLPDTAEGTSVTFNIPGSSISAPLFFVSSAQINAQIPFGVPVGTGTVSVQVRRGSETSATQPVQVADVSPGIFTVNQNGTGAGAILHADNFQAVSPIAPARPRVAYYIQGGDKTIYFTGRGVTFALTAALTGAGDGKTSSEALVHPASYRGTGGAKEHGPQREVERWVVKLDFVDANPNVRPVGQEPTAAVISYFKGPREEWTTGLPTYASLVPGRSFTRTISSRSATATRHSPASSS